MAAAAPRWKGSTIGKPIRSFTKLCFAIVALGLIGQARAAADELVSFAPALRAPQAAGVNNGANPLPRIPGIAGYLTRPKGNGPFPAVVLLHSCLGLPADRRSIANNLARWGYVTLFVDDFTTRGIKETCAVDFPQGLADAFGALAFVAKLPYVDSSSIAAVGYSQGADTALQIASSPADAGLLDRLSFKAVAAFYPPCEDQLDVGARLQLPTLILVGAADTVTPALQCQRLVESQPRADVKLVVYPGAGHLFDDRGFAGGKRVLGMWLQFEPKAAAQSQLALREFLAAKLRR